MTVGQAATASALTPRQLRGLQTFDHLGCTRCHQSPAFSGPCKPDGHFARFRKHDIPQTEIHRLHDDVVRFAVTGRETDRHKFKVPTLRNLALAAPNLHNGVVATLPDAVRIMAATQ